MIHADMTFGKHKVSVKLPDETLPSKIIRELALLIDPTWDFETTLELMLTQEITITTMVL